ncbi:MAG: hypothetical protein ACPHRA_16180, partial [Limisphaerales bacterium]
HSAADFGDAASSFEGASPQPENQVAMNIKSGPETHLWLAGIAKVAVSLKIIPDHPWVGGSSF